MSIPSEALPALVAGGIGIVAAAVFVFSGASAQPTSWNKEEKEAKSKREEATAETEETDDDAEPNEVKDADTEGAKVNKPTQGQSVGTAKAKGAEKEVDKEGKGATQPAKEGDLPVDFLKMRPGKLSSEQEDKFRQGLANLPPESKKALQEWVNMTENSTWTLIGINCLFLVCIAGLLTLAAAAIVGIFQINIFNPDVWRAGYAKLQVENDRFWSQVTPPAPPRAREIAHDRHVDLAEL